MSRSSVCEVVSPPQSEEMHYPSRVRVRVLMLDDDEDDVILTRWILSKVPNFEVEMDWASNVQETFQAFREDMYDLYLIDYQLGMDSGIDVLRYASRLGMRMPKYLLTGFDDPKIEHAARRAGATGCLNKNGLDTQKLSEVLNSSLACPH